MGTEANQSPLASRSQVEVNGLSSSPLFAWLKAASGSPGDIPWNFSKFLVICGTVVKRYSHEVGGGCESISRVKHKIYIASFFVLLCMFFSVLLLFVLRHVLSQSVLCVKARVCVMCVVFFLEPKEYLL